MISHKIKISIQFNSIQPNARYSDHNCVSMTGLDMRTTPLDRMTCIYDTVEQVGVHIREAVLEAHADSEARNSKLLQWAIFIYFVNNL